MGNIVKSYKKVERLERVLDQLICDICKEEFDKDYYNLLEEYKDEWFGSCCIVDFWMMDNNSDAILSFDICPKCFMNKLIPWMKKEFNSVPNTEMG